jgi:plasmid stabilization system protein ParE
MNDRKISWSPRATKQFNAAIAFIRQDSYQNADLVKEKIISKISSLKRNTVTHRKDSYRKNNDGHFYYFEIVNYPVSYYDNGNEIIIVRVRHVSMKPMKY